MENVDKILIQLISMLSMPPNQIQYDEHSRSPQQRKKGTWESTQPVL